MALFNLVHDHADLCVQVFTAQMQNYRYPVGGQWSAAKISHELKHHFGIAVAGVNPNELDGFCLYRRPPGAHFSEIMLIATHPQNSRQGVATSLINELKGRLEAGERLWLEVHHLNLPAVKFYERSGFSKVGERKAYYSDGGHAWLYEYHR